MAKLSAYEYSGVIIYNNGKASKIRAVDLDSLKDVLCTFSFPRRDVEHVKVYKCFRNSPDLQIGLITKGSYHDI